MSTELMQGTLEQEIALTVADRCDQCGAQAFVRATMLSGGELLFCSHDYNTHKDALEGRAMIHNETDKIK